MATATTKEIAELANSQEYVTVRTAADFTHTSEPTIRRMLTKKKLQRYRFQGRTLIRLSELRALVRAV
jgi:excisionase family DNA binding protein